MAGVDQQKGPLAHLRVIELAGLAPVPYCGQILKQFGADVIHVSRYGAAQSDDPAGLGLGKRSISLDLKSKEGIQVLHRMLKNADVLLDVRTLLFSSKLTVTHTADAPRSVGENGSRPQVSVEGD